MNKNRRDELQSQKSLIFTTKDDRPKTKSREDSASYLGFGPLLSCRMAIQSLTLLSSASQIQQVLSNASYRKKFENHWFIRCPASSLDLI